MVIVVRAFRYAVLAHVTSVHAFFEDALACSAAEQCGVELLQQHVNRVQRGDPLVVSDVVTGLDYTWRIDASMPNFLAQGSPIFKYTSSSMVRTQLQIGDVEDLVSEDSRTYGVDIASKMSAEADMSKGIGKVLSDGLSVAAQASLENTYQQASQTKTIRMDRDNRVMLYKDTSAIPYLQSILRPEWKTFLLTSSVKNIHDTLGDFYADQIIYGGLFHSTVVMEMKVGDTKSKLKGSLKANFESVLGPSLDVSGSVDSKQSTSLNHHSVTSSTRVTGGDPKMWLGFKGNNLEEIQDKWAASVTDHNAFPVKYRVRPLWDLLMGLDDNKAAELEQYVVQLWDSEANKTIPTAINFADACSTHKDCTVGHCLAGSCRESLKPVFGYLYSSVMPYGDYGTVHFPPAWSGEREGQLEFYAFSKQVAGTKSVWNFWNDWYSCYSFHFEPGWHLERGYDIQFYAYESHVNGTEPVYDFWVDSGTYRTFHFLPARDGETQGSVQFYAVPQ